MSFDIQSILNTPYTDISRKGIKGKKQKPLHNTIVFHRIQCWIKCRAQIKKDPDHDQYKTEIRNVSKVFAQFGFPGQGKYQGGKIAYGHREAKNIVQGVRRGIKPNAKL